MTTAAESEVLTRVGAGTPMGDLMRQYWIPAAMAFAETGAVPPGAFDSTSFMRARAGDFVVPEGMDWQDAYDRLMKASQNPTGRLSAAE